MIRDVPIPRGFNPTEWWRFDFTPDTEPLPSRHAPPGLGAKILQGQKLNRKKKWEKEKAEKRAAGEVGLFGKAWRRRTTMQKFPRGVDRLMAVIPVGRWVLFSEIRRRVPGMPPGSAKRWMDDLRKVGAVEWRQRHDIVDLLPGSKYYEYRVTEVGLAWQDICRMAGLVVAADVESTD